MVCGWSEFSFIPCTGIAFWLASVDAIIKATSWKAAEDGWLPSLMSITSVAEDAEVETKPSFFLLEVWPWPQLLRWLYRYRCLPKALLQVLHWNFFKWTFWWSFRLAFWVNWAWQISQLKDFTLVCTTACIDRSDWERNALEQWEQVYLLGM